MTLTSGSRLGAYEIVSPLGVGGMGEVYRARDTRLNRMVAVKVLRDHVAANPLQRARFEREARIISQLNHPHICSLFDVGHDNGIDYLVMEHLEGQTLAERLQQHPLRLDDVLEYAIQIGDALDAAHRKGIVHRDLKPANIFVVHRDGPSRSSDIKLLDFGVARIIEDEQSASGESHATTGDSFVTLTREGAFVGTLHYMAPEQFEGCTADARSDLFAFGCVLYEMLTGRRPFTGASPSAVVAAVLDSDPAPIRLGRDATAPALDRLVRSCLAKDPEERTTLPDLVNGLRSVRRSRRGGEAVESGPDIGVTERASLRADLNLPISTGTARSSSRGMPLWLSLLLIPLGIAGLGLLMSAVFNQTIGLSARFEREAGVRIFVWGMRSLVAPTLLVVVSGFVFALVRALGRALSARSTLAHRIGADAGGRLSVIVHKLSLRDPEIVAQAIAILGAFFLMTIVWRFSELIYAFSHPINDMLPEQLSELDPNNTEIILYRISLTLFILILSFATWHLFSMRRRLQQRDRVGWPVLDIVVLVLSVVLLETPYRVFYHADFERIDVDATRCYRLGEDRFELLLHCPTAAPPRNRVIKPDHPSLKRLGFQQNLFEPPVEVASETEKNCSTIPCRTNDH